MTVKTRFSPFLKPLVLVVSLTVISSAHGAETTEADAVQDPWAFNLSTARGRFELNCPLASGTVLSQKVTYINGLGMGGGGEYEWTESTISVIGPEKSINISLVCLN